MLLNDALNASDKVDGWLTSNEQTLLYNRARKVPADKTIAELGAWLGKSTIMLAAGSTAGAKAPVYAVDFFELHGEVSEQYSRFLDPETHEYLPMFLKNIRTASLGSIVTPIKSSTTEAAKNWTGPRIGLLFIDANHGYSGVLGDFLAWAGLCSPAASLAFHDHGREHGTLAFLGLSTDCC